MTYRQKQTLIRVLVVVVAIALVFAIVSLLKNNNDDNYSKIRTKWTVGGLTEEGTCDKDIEGSMVSDRIEIGEGFKIAPDFNKGVTYEVYFYDESDNYLGKYGNNPMSTILEVSVEDLEEMFTDLDETVPTYFRVVLTPDDADGEIKQDLVHFERWKYSGHIEIFELEGKKK